ncbi:MAG: DUF2332 domain-containing protein [Streptosporangiaceae bacterium]
MATQRDQPVSGTADELRRLERFFRIFAATQCHGHSLVYERLSEGIAGDEDTLRLLMQTPQEQRRPSLLLAAVNLLLASHPDSALAAYYPTHAGLRPVDAQLLPAFSAFCSEHRGDLVRLLREGSTQTNEIRRCVALRVGLAHVQRRWPGPLALAEAGASAGLNLLFDRYRYRLGGDEPTSAASQVVIGCELRGDAPAGRVLGAIPEVTSRLGIDREPVDLADPAARAWLEAFIWPERTDDLATLRAAIDVARTAPALAVVRGDATTDTVRLLSGLPGNEPVVVFTASLLSYLTPGGRAAFAGQLRLAAGRRPVAWVFAEAPGLAATMNLTAPALAGPLAQRNTLYLVGASLRGPGSGRDDRLLALADPYLRWLAPARTSTDDFAWVG